MQSLHRMFHVLGDMRLGASGSSVPAHIGRDAFGQWRLLNNSKCPGLHSGTGLRSSLGRPTSGLPALPREQRFHIDETEFNRF